MDADPDLLAHFMKYFEILRADTPELLEEAFRLRYQVYCEQLSVPGFNPQAYPDGLEHDVYDKNAVHRLLRHRPSGTYAGVVRLMLANPAEPDTPFPVEAAADQRIDREFLRKFVPCRQRIGEVSRLILAERFRLRKGERQWPDGVAEVIDDGHGRHEQRVLPHPILGLVKAATRITWEYGIDYVYTAMEPRLNRRLRQFGLVLTPVSPLVNYHGPVRVYWGFLPEVFAGIHREHPEIWALLTDNGEVWPPTTPMSPRRGNRWPEREERP